MIQSKMRKGERWIIGLFISFGILCTTILTNLPIPEVSLSPPQVPFGFSPPWDVFADEQIFFVQQQENPFVERISVSHEGAYVYKYGYYWNPSALEWVQFTFPQITLPGRNWIPEEASIEIDLEKTGISREDFYVVSYSCKKINNEWKCGCISQDNCGFWMYQNPSLVINVTANPTHLECVNNMCLRVPGDAPNTCSLLNEPCTTVPTNQTNSSQSTNNLTFYNNQNQIIAQLTETGNILLKGACFKSTAIAPAGAFVIENPSTQTPGIYIDENGNLVFRATTCVDPETNNNICSCPIIPSANCVNPEVTNLMEIKNQSGGTVISIRESNICLTGTLQQNVTFP